MMQYIWRAGMTVGVLGYAPVTAWAQFVPVSQMRWVAATAACDGVPVTDEAHAKDFGPFSAMVQVDSANGSDSYTQMRATQSSSIGPDGVSGTVGTDLLSRMCPGATSSSVCEVVFDIEGPGATAVLTAEYTGTSVAPAPCTLQLSDTVGLLIDRRLFARETVNTSVVLGPGRYTFLAHAFPYVSSGGSTMFSGSAMSFDLTFEELSPPVVDGPVVRRPGTCGRYVRLSPSTWVQARQAALEMGGILATIDDADEEAFLRGQPALFDARAAIGLSDPDGDGVFEWMDGAPVSYTNWGKGEPVAGHLFAYMVGTPEATTWESGNGTDPLSSSIVELGDCVCDWTLDNDVTSADFFSFLTAFFEGDADLNCSGSTDSADFFDFLACFFGKGC